MSAVREIQDEIQGWTSAVGRSFRAALTMERVVSEPGAIARAVLAVVAAAVLGGLTGDPLAWAMLSVGTFICGIGTLLAPVRHRVVNAFALGAAFTLAALAGVWLHQAGWYFLIVLAVLAYLAGLWRALGVAPGIRACLVVIGCMITADLAATVEAGLIMVRWMAAGAALTVAAQLLPPYGRRHPAQRKALAALYAALAAYARTEQAGYPAPAPFTAARRALDLLPRFARPGAAPLYGLLVEAERVRRALLLVSGAPKAPREAIAEGLDSVARALRTSRRQPLAPDSARALENWRGPMAEELLPSLDEAGRLVGLWADRENPDGSVLALFPAEHPARAGLRRLGAAARPGDPLFPHALRVAVGTTAGEAAGRALGDFWGHGLPGHGFWAALTTLLVLFPDYGHTFARGWARPIGSILGGLAAWAALRPAWWTPDRLVVAAVLLTACVFLTLRVGQLVLNFFITAWLVVLIARLGKAPDLVAWGRPADTLLGAMIGLLVFVVLPTYHHDRLSSLVAEWTDAQRQLLNVLVGGLTEPGVVRHEDIDALRARNRHTRERLEAAVAALRHEPRGHRAHWNATGVEAVQRSIADLNRCASQLYAAQPRRDTDAVPEAAEIAALFDARLTALADALDSGAPIPPATLRTSFDESARRGGLTDLADHRSPDGIAHARARALTLCLRTALAVDTFTACLAPDEGTGGVRVPGTRVSPEWVNA
ncbi:FUSC family protein [Streptomyces sp. NPDC021098]|uniref:FUSC family protein n=1 Tax=unclassified Streptomyces TaxID=2593676 RepID=UPI003793A109